MIIFYVIQEEANCLPKTQSEHWNFEKTYNAKRHLNCEMLHIPTATTTEALLDLGVSLRTKKKINISSQLWRICSWPRPLLDVSRPPQDLQLDWHPMRRRQLPRRLRLWHRRLERRGRQLERRLLSHRRSRLQFRHRLPHELHRSQVDHDLHGGPLHRGLDRPHHRGRGALHRSGMVLCWKDFDR